MSKRKIINRINKVLVTNSFDIRILIAVLYNADNENIRKKNKTRRKVNELKSE